MVFTMQQAQEVEALRAQIAAITEAISAQRYNLCHGGMLSISCSFADTMLADLASIGDEAYAAAMQGTRLNIAHGRNTPPVAAAPVRQFEETF